MGLRWRGLEMQSILPSQSLTSVLQSVAGSLPSFTPALSPHQHLVCIFFYSWFKAFIVIYCCLTYLSSSISFRK